MHSQPTRHRKTVLSVLAALCALLLVAAATPAMLEQGKKLFVGELAVEARMVGHDLSLPREAVRCSNCHLREQAVAPATTQNFGPKLGPVSLTRPLSRRGGPPSAYTQATFCKLLREGIDPAHVMIPQTMPRYTFTDAECEALWMYLVTP